MASSVREQILANVKTSLEAIKISGGYEVDVETVIRVQQSPYDAMPLPAIVIYDLGEDKEEGNPNQFTNCTLHLEIIFWNSGGYENMSEEANKLSASIEKALGVDYKRGGLAIDTDIVRNSFTLDAENFPVGGGSVSVDIMYRHRVMDPYTQ